MRASLVDTPSTIDIYVPQNCGIDDTAQDIRGQTAQVLAMVDRLLAEAGSDKSRILMTQIFLADIGDIAAMNEVWDAWIPAGNTPPRATVQAAMANAAYKIEIVVTAAAA